MLNKLNSVKLTQKEDELFTDSYSSYILSKPELIKQMQNYLLYKSFESVSDNIYAQVYKSCKSYYHFSIKINLNTLSFYILIFEKSTETKDAPVYQPIFNFDLFKQTSRTLKLDLHRFIFSDNLKNTFIFNSFKYFVNTSLNR